MFWEYLERITADNEMVIDRPKGTKHPAYNDMVYPVDYGYIKNTKSMDGQGIDIFIGSEKSKRLDAIICIIDMLKKDSEIKIVLGCTENEKVKIYDFLNSSECMKVIMIKR